MVCSNRTRNKNLKLEEGSFRLDIRMNYFIMRMVRHRIRLPNNFWMAHHWIRSVFMEF